MAITAHNSALDLGGEYTLSAPAREIATTMTLPGDVHHALLAADLIPDPYFGENEKVVMWVNETAWSVERRFSASAADIDGYLTLTLAEVDCIATIVLNGEEIARTDNSFVRNDIDVTGKVKAGTNTLRFEFAVTQDVAKARADAHPFPIPYTYNYLSNGLPGVHMNFVRKTACHAGWDWGIRLMPTGVYGRMAIRRSRLGEPSSPPNCMRMLMHACGSSRVASSRASRSVRAHWSKPRWTASSKVSPVACWYSNRPCGNSRG